MQTSQDYQEIRKFMDELLDLKSWPMIDFLKAQESARDFIKYTLDRNPNLQKILSSHHAEPSFVNEMIVTSTLMQVIRFSTSWALDSHILQREEGAGIPTEECVIYVKFADHCKKAYELIKTDDVLIQMALNLDFKKFESEFIRSIESIVSESIENDLTLQNFYKNRSKARKKAMQELTLKFLKYAYITQNHKGDFL